MASGGKRGGAGERVLESRHVIGLFMLMLLFSGVFFTLGYVMGRNEYDGSVRAATDFFRKPSISVPPKVDVNPKRTSNPAPAAAPKDTPAPPNSDWEFYHAGDKKKTEDRLKPVAVAAAPAKKSSAVPVRSSAPPRNSGSSAKSPNAPLIPVGSYTLQVAALTKEADAMELASRLQKKKIPAFVLSPQGDKYYRVQVGPYADPKAAEAARKGLEDAGFKAIVKH
ncbi:MAG TPA: SPOR domain-containing protein [Candidatus Polarisedimenticolia bacterium]|nr:SPOR domain-containing protein [Candidatus Polarisedimenticolia bacterium]